MCVCVSVFTESCRCSCGVQTHLVGRGLWMKHPAILPTSLLAPALAFGLVGCRFAICPGLGEECGEVSLLLLTAPCLHLPLSPPFGVQDEAHRGPWLLNPTCGMSYKASCKAVVLQSSILGPFLM